jgi:hypothetical protein
MVNFLEFLEGAAILLTIVTVMMAVRRRPVRRWAIAAAIAIVGSAALELYLRLID